MKMRLTLMLIIATLSAILLVSQSSQASPAELPVARNELVLLHGADMCGAGDLAAITGSTVHGDSWASKPVEVTIQLHLEEVSDKAGVERILAEIEVHNPDWRTTVFVTPYFASSDPRTVRAIERRGHQIAVVGVEEGISPITLNYAEQKAALERSILAVRAVAQHPEEVVDWKPQDFRWNADTLRALQSLRVRSISDVFPCNDSFNCQCLHALSLGRVTFPYPMQTGFWAIPISDFQENSQLLVLDDRRVFAGSATPQDYLKYLLQKYGEQEKSKDPLIIAVHGSIVGTDDARFGAFSQFLEHVVNTGGKVVTLNNFLTQSYITNFNVQGPSTPLQVGSQATLTVSYRSTLYCPKYRFRAYGKYEGENWQLVASSCYYVSTGDHSFNFQITIPKPPTGQTVYTVRVVGQASFGTCDNSDPNWPTSDKYEVMKEVQINVYPRCISLPGRTAGKSEGRLDILFVPDTDYGTPQNIDTWLPTFLSEINAQIDQRLGGKSPVTGNLDKFNFHYTRDQGNAEPSSNGPQSTLPTDLLKDCTFADAIVVLHKTEFGDSSSVGQKTNIYSAEGPIGRSFIHESGHGLFGLADEYDGDTPYFQPDPNPNIWATQDACRTDATSAGWNPDDCTKFTDRQGDWWKLGTTAYIMEDGTHFDNGWGAPASWRITGVLNQYRASTRKPAGALAVPLPSNTTQLNLTLSDSGFAVDRTARLKDTPPNQLAGTYAYRARLLSFGGQVLGEFGFGNPRYIYGESGYTGPTYLSSASFSLNLPYYYDGKTVQIYDSGGTLVETIDITSLASGGISGTVTDSSGQPVADARVEVIGPDFAAVTTASNGQYSIQGLRAGSYVLNVIPPASTNLIPAALSVSVTAGQMTTANVSLQLGTTVQGRVTDAAGRPVPNAILYMSGYETPRYSTDSDGYYVIKGLTPGSYTLNIDSTEKYHIYVNSQFVVEGTSVNLTATAGLGITVDFFEKPPVIQVTTNPADDWRPAIARSSDGKLWVVWHSWRSDNNIWYKTSDDNGATWSADTQLTSDPSSDYDPAIMQASDDTIWVVWYSYRLGNWDLYYKTSTDGGVTWSPDTRLTTHPSSDYGPAITQTSDGKIWVVWYSYRSGNADIWYKASSDGGATWSSDVQLTTASQDDYRPAIAQTSEGKIWVFWDSWRSDHPALWYKTSTDGGASWSADAEFSTDTKWDYAPVIGQTSDSTIWVARMSWSWDLWNWDIWSRTSTDGGTTWSADQQFTRFTGPDLYPGLAALPDDQAALVWSSDRAVSYDIWFGIIGVHADSNPPPHLDSIQNYPWPNPDSNDIVTIRADVSDETGISSVILKWSKAGTPQPDLTMYDDGAHDDYGPNDGWYGVQIGPFPVGTIVEYQVEVTDVDGNIILAPQYPMRFESLEPFVRTADILFVPDYGGYDTSWFRGYYEDALGTLGYRYDVWDTGKRGEIDSATLNQYTAGAVIWAVPYWGFVTDYDSTRNTLQSFLDSGGNLFITGQNIGSYAGWTSFYQDYLHADYVQNNVGLTNLTGVSGDPVGDGLSFSIAGGDGANNQYSPDEIDPVSPAVTVLTYSGGSAAAKTQLPLPEEVEERMPLARPDESTPSRVPKGDREAEYVVPAAPQACASTCSAGIRADTGTYKVVHFAFGFESINSRLDRRTAMGKVLNWFGMTPPADIVQVTTNVADDWAPSIAHTNDGKLWVVWHSWRSDNNIYYKTSADNGVTWSADMQLTTDPNSDYDPAIMQANDGTIWVVWYSYRSGNADIWYKTSTDGGATWSDATQLTNDPSWDGAPVVAQTDAGRVWVVWESSRSGNQDIWYKTSSDGGVTWSAAAQLTTDTTSDWWPGIVQTSDGRIWVVWESNRSGQADIWYRISGDGGTTWSAATQLTTSSDWDYWPGITESADGTMWVVWSSFRNDNGDLWYRTSTDGGTTWSAEQRFTQFTGWDEAPAVAPVGGNQVALVWHSDRAVNFDVWFGIIGAHGDVNPPPHLDFIRNYPWPNPDSNDTTTIRAQVSDETGISSVTLKWSKDGTPQPDLAMYDDGAHDDYAPDDGWYGVQIGPFPVGTVIQYQVEVTDVDGNTILAPQYRMGFESLEPFVKTADILFVPDYGGYDTGWFRGYYENTLAALGYDYDVWDTGLRGAPDRSILNLYTTGVVIWAAPDWGYFDDWDVRPEIEAYLDAGGRLFISGQDVAQDLSGTTLLSDYLHATWVQDRTYLYTLSGVIGDPIGDGLMLGIAGGDGADNQYDTDEIDPISPAVTVFTYDMTALAALAEPVRPEVAWTEREGGKPSAISIPAPWGESREPQEKPTEAEPAVGLQGIISSGTAGLRVDTGTYKVVYFAFGFEAINSAGDRQLVMERILDWTWSLPGDLDFNCVVNVADIMRVASRWRMTDTDPDWNPRYDLNGDGIITVVDIMPVVKHWGETCESALLYVLTEDGVVEVSLTGGKQTIIGAHGGTCSIEIFEDKLYASEGIYGGNILVYDLQGNPLKTIPIPSQASEYLCFVTLPGERIALMDNVNDKVYFIDSSGNLLATTNILDTPDYHAQNLDGVVVNNRLILSEDGNNHILQIDLDTYEGAIFRDLSSLPHWLGAITYSEGQYYVCGPQTIYAFSEGDDAVQIAGIPESNITGIVVIGNSAYVSVNFAGKIYKVNLSNGVSSVFASDLNFPADLER